MFGKGIAYLRLIPQLPRRYPRIFSEGAWALFGQFCTAVGMLVGVRLTTGFVPKELYGTLSLLAGVAALGRSTLQYPIGQGQLRFYPEMAMREELWLLRRTIDRLLLRSSIYLTVLTIAGGLIYSRFEGIGLLSFVLLSGTYHPEAARQVELNYLSMARRQRAVALLNSFDALLRPAGIITAVLLFGATLNTLLGAGLVLSAALYGITLLAPRREGLLRPATGPEPTAASAELARAIWSYARPLIPLGVVSWTISLSDRYLLGAYLGTGPVGIYAAVYGLASQPFLIVQTAMQRTLVAVYYRAVADGDRAKQSKTMRGWLAATIGICGAGFVASLFLKNLVARIFLAPEYRSGANLIPWIAAGYMLWAIGSVFESQLHAQKRTQRILLVNVCTAVLSLVTPLLFIRWWGLIGAARACPVYFLGMAVLMFALSRERTVAGGPGAGPGGHEEPTAPQPAPAPLPEPMSSAPFGTGGLEQGA